MSYDLNQYNALQIYNLYNHIVFISNLFCNKLSKNDFIEELINTEIDYSNMNSYNKEYYKALVSSFKNCFYKE